MFLNSKFYYQNRFFISETSLIQAFQTTLGTKFSNFLGLKSTLKKYLQVLYKIFEPTYFKSFGYHS